MIPYIDIECIDGTSCISQIAATRDLPITCLDSSIYLLQALLTTGIINVLNSEQTNQPTNQKCLKNLVN